MLDVNCTLIVLQSHIKEEICSVCKALELEFCERDGIDDKQVFIADRLFLKTLTDVIHKITSGYVEMPLPLFESKPDHPNNRGISLEWLNHLSRNLSATQISVMNT